MKRYAVVADVHIHNFPQFAKGDVMPGVNTRCSASLDTLYKAVHMANTHACTDFVVCGDLFDNDRPTPQVEAAVATTLRQFNGRVRLIPGNHDMTSTQRGDHALGPLETIGKITVYDEPTLFDTIAYIPFRPEPVSTWLPQQLADLGCDSTTAALVAHFGVIDRDTPEYMYDVPDAITAVELQQILSDFGIGRAFVGNWHNAQSWKNIHQIGTLNPVGFKDAGLDGGHMAIFADHEVKRFRFPGLRFLDVPDFESFEIPKGSIYERSCTYALRLTISPDQLTDAKVWLSDNNVEHFAIRTVNDKVLADARALARAPSKAKTRDTVDAYIAALTLPANVQRAELRRVVRQYLKG